MSEDAILRAALAERAAVPRLLALLPADAVAGLDPTRLRPLAVDHIGRSGRARRGDIAWALGAPTSREPEAEALLAVECQSSPHPRMALRMMVYAGLLWQALAASRPKRPPAAGAAGGHIHRRPALAPQDAARAAARDAAGPFRPQPGLRLRNA